MKKILLFMVLTMVILTNVLSQSCLPNGITFTTQSQIDNFQMNYPNCSEIEGNVTISDNNITNLIGLSTLTTIDGYLKIYNCNSLLNLSGLNNLTSINGGVLDIKYNLILENLSGLENLTSTIGLDFQFNWALVDLSGLEGLTSLSFLGLFHNPSLIDLSGIENVTEISSVLWIDENYDLINLNGLDNVESVGDEIRITGNSSLENIQALSNITSINGMLSIYYNLSLTSLSGLDNINPQTISSLYLVNNNALQICNVQSICDYIEIPTKPVDISDNEVGCDNVGEVEEACFVSVLKNTKKSEMLIYPNPTNTDLFIESEVTIIEVIIYNLIGQIIIEKKGIIRHLDISNLESGYYIIDLVSNNNRKRQKLVIK